MNFVSFDFWVHLIVGGALIWILRLFLVRTCPKRSPNYDKWSLLLLSLSLLFRESALTLGAFLYVSGVVWFGTRWAISCTDFRRKVVIASSVVLSLLPLLFFKYAGFLCRDVLGISVGLWTMGLIPAGLSFYTFQLIGFMIDRVARNEHDRLKTVDFINFASVFPQIVAGPIERVGHLLPQVQQFSWHISGRRLNDALKWIIYGLFLKMAIANNIAEQSKWIHSALTNPFQIWLANLVFAYRIYFDFAGYSFIAIGLGKLLNIELTVNFRSPYTATNIQDFWRRWHITLSGWFRDYVYMPLGGGRAGRHVVRNILLVFVVSGLWHGAGWNFILWGAFHGLMLCLFRVYKGRFKMPTPLAWAVCFVAVLLSWLLFYERDFALLSAKTAVIFNPFTYDMISLRATLDVCPGLGNKVALGLAMAFSIFVHILERVSYNRYGEHASFFLHPVATVIMVVLVVVLAPTSENGFIYFNF